MAAVSCSQNNCSRSDGFALPLGFSAGAWMQKDQATSRSAARHFTDWKMCDFTSCHAGSKPQPVHDKYKPFRKSGTATVLPSKSASNPLISLGIFLGVCFSYRLGMETSLFLKKMRVNEGRMNPH
jgi:hypothetical protein